MTELKMCPFCGNPDSPLLTTTRKAWDWHGEYGDYHIVVCDASSWNEKNGCGASSPNRGSKEEAIAAWNRRAGDKNV